MKKLIDFDGLFDEKLAEYIRSNPEKKKKKQWENVIPRLYKQFGDIYVAAAGSTPKEYYASMSDEELCETLERHVAEEAHEVEVAHGAKRDGFAEISLHSLLVGTSTGE